MANMIITSWWMRQIQCEYLIIKRQKQSLVQSLLFFLMFVAFFPLAIPYDPAILRTICPGVVWMSATLAVFLSAERFYQQDIEQGCLEQWLVQKLPLTVYVGIKLFMHGMLHLTAMLLMSPFIALMFQLSFGEWQALTVSLIAGMPALVAMCGLVSAFGSYGQSRSLVMILILLPLILPVIMLGSSSIAAAMQGLSIAGFLAFLLALSLTMLLILPFATASILKICLQQGVS